MGPVFYLVQSNGALRPISALPLKNWPRLFGSARLGQKKPLRSPPKKKSACGAPRNAMPCRACQWASCPAGSLKRGGSERGETQMGSPSTVFAGKLSQQSVVCC